MMRKKCFIGILVALCVCFVATSCSKNESASQEQITENFKALVMGGKDIDPNHTWSTGVSIPVTIRVNLETGTTYNVYFFVSNPATDVNTQHIGMASLISGESKTVYVTKPAGATQIYAACYGPHEKSICLPVYGSEVTFSGTIPSEPTMPKPSTGNRWSVFVQDMPSVTKYTQGDMIEANDFDPEKEGTTEIHLKISSDYTGFIPYLTSYQNLSIYVTGTWTLTFEQRFVNGSVLVVGKGGKVVIPKGFKLTTSPLTDSQKPGMIYVLPGGEISGEGELELTDGNGTYSYNAGSIINNEIHLASGSLYNSGNIGDSNNTNTALYGEVTSGDAPGQLFNYGSAYFSQASGSALSIMNNNFMKVKSVLSLSSLSRMDDGSVIECGSLSLQGDASSNSVLYMGNAAYLNCSGSISVNNYGVWGPTGDNYHDNALFSSGSCTVCTATPGNDHTYMLDHVQLQLPTTFKGFDQIADWVNGNGGGISSDRQTCFFVMENSAIPNNNCMLYAFEFPGDNSIRDFDYNDLVLSVGIPQDNGDGTYISTVDIMAIGSTVNIYVLYNDSVLGTEVHEAMGVSTKYTTNTTEYKRSPRRLGELTFNSADVNLCALPFSVRIEKSDGGNSSTYTQKGNTEAPLYLAINGDENGKWFWPKEGSNIGLTYMEFSVWANNQQLATDWYLSSNASSAHIIKW